MIAIICRVTVPMVMLSALLYVIDYYGYYKF